MAETAYIMSATTFIEKCIDIARNYKTLYVLGTWGWPASAKNKSRAISKNAWNATTARKTKINAAKADTFFFDCAGLIKGILWGWCGDVNRPYGGAGYAVNGVPDSSSLIKLCKDVSTDFSNIVPGELLYLSGDMGHVGVYVGEGKVIECTPKWEDGVQMTYLGNIGYNTGHYRIWEQHGKLPWIDYASVLGELNAITAPAELASKEDIFTGDILPYIVVKGDNLTKIAKKFSTTMDKIIELNKLDNPNKIFVGQKLLVQGTATKNDAAYVYIVQSGDTLSEIARKYKTTVIAIQAKNGILNPNKIVTGQVLKIA